jgi:CheY-like chemotaxis protein
MSKRILVVEDQPDNRQIIRDMLADTDYEISEAENGEEARLRLWRSGDPISS